MTISSYTWLIAHTTSVMPPTPHTMCPNWNILDSLTGKFELFAGSFSLSHRRRNGWKKELLSLADSLGKRFGNTDAIYGWNTIRKCMCNRSAASCKTHFPCLKVVRLCWRKCTKRSKRRLRRYSTSADFWWMGSHFHKSFTCCQKKSSLKDSNEHLGIVLWYFSRQKIRLKFKLLQVRARTELWSRISD